MFKVVADKLVVDAGVTPLLHAMVVEAVVKNDTIKGIVIESKSGRQAILAKRVIDCTGDGNVIAKAGVPTSKVNIKRVQEELQRQNVRVF